MPHSEVRKTRNGEVSDCPKSQAWAPSLALEPAPEHRAERERAAVSTRTLAMLCGPERCTRCPGGSDLLHTPL